MPCSNCNSMSLRKSIELAPQVEKVREISEAMVADVAAVSDDPNLLFRINIGLTEALTNSIVHGCKTPSESVSLIYQINKDDHIFHIHDPGTGPTEGQLTDPKVDDDLLSDHHRGQVIIHWAADEVSYSASENGFDLILLFRSRDE